MVLCGGASAIRISGRAVAVRKFHKKLTFVHLHTDGEEDVELVFRQPGVQLHVGIHLAVMGTYDEFSSRRMPAYAVVSVHKAQTIDAPLLAKGADAMAAAGVPRSGILCRLWITGRCVPSSSNPCPYRHFCISLTEHETRDRLVQLREEQGSREFQDPDDPYQYDSKLRKGARARIFARWLADTFTVERLQSGSGVVDVAGGKGRLAFELYFRHGVDVSTIDPMPNKRSGKQKKMLRKCGLERVAATMVNNELGVVMDAGDYNDDNGDHDDNDGEEEEDEEGEGSKHGIEAVNTNRGTRRASGCTSSSGTVVNDLGSSSSSSSSTSSSNISSSTSNSTSNSTSSISNSTSSSTSSTSSSISSSSNNTASAHSVGTHRHFQELFSLPSITEHPLVGPILNECALIVGLHPDQATEAIVDYALLNNKSFAVVPCCVFPSLFPHRRKLKVQEKAQEQEQEIPPDVSEAETVTAYEDLVRYILHKAPGSKLAYLNFHGRNKVIYRIVDS